MKEALDISVSGIVQGVGFRPFVYRLAKRNLISGWVLNDASGVFIHAEGDAKLLDEFVLEIAENAPAAAVVREIEMREVPLQGCATFEIRASEEAPVEDMTLISADLATCDECVAELFDPENRRFHYPFINCTNCGPRFTIIDHLPYDRPATSMRAFNMCNECAIEYADPADRRFHAQPDACFECGPSLCFAVLASDVESAASADPVTLSNGGTADAATFAGAPLASGSEGSYAEACFASEPEAGLGIGETLVGSGAPGAGALGEPGGRGLSAPGSWQWAHTREESDALIERTVQALRAGKIVAVKGLGGFHLVCDAASADALAELRRRKRREGKAFAVMVADAQEAQVYCQVSAEEEKLLNSPARPIVLLRKRPGVQLAKGLADCLPELGVMLPATPVQHLLMRAFGGMLVFTSGNVHDEPIQTDDAQAAEALAGIADCLLGNNRAIRSRYDDSVVRVLSFGQGQTAIQFIRRARGYSPVPLPFDVRRTASERGMASEGGNPPVHSGAARVDEGAASAGQAGEGIAIAGQAGVAQTGAALDLAGSCVFATGAEQKSTLCFVRGADAFVSQHIGDLENAPTYDAWLQAKETYERLFDLEPKLVACDMHPEYLTSKWARAQGLPVTAVQHHHAHIASVLAENKLFGPAIGFSFDGTGFGVDGAIWGGEVLLANVSAFERFANFAYFPLPGGAAAIRNPKRCAYGALWAFDQLEHPAAVRMLAGMGEQRAVCERMVQQGLNCPQTSSVGRLFDAASALLGVCTQPTYEGEGAILLEAAIGADAGTEADAGIETDENAGSYHIEIVKNTATAQSTAADTSVVLLDAAPLFAALLDDIEAGMPVSAIAKRFHDAFVEVILSTAILVRAAYDVTTVALSGGVFMNRYLVEHVVAVLADAGFTVCLNQDLPPNDANISYGQAAVACVNNNLAL